MLNYIFCLIYRKRFNSFLVSLYKNLLQVVNFDVKKNILEPLTDSIALGKFNSFFSYITNFFACIVGSFCNFPSFAEK